MYMYIETVFFLPEIKEGGTKIFLFILQLYVLFEFPNHMKVISFLR